jgi:hypothetical protein
MSLYPSWASPALQAYDAARLDCHARTAFACTTDNLAEEEEHTRAFWEQVYQDVVDAVRASDEASTGSQQ